MTSEKGWEEGRSKRLLTLMIRGKHRKHGTFERYRVACEGFGSPRNLTCASLSFSIWFSAIHDQDPPGSPKDQAFDASSCSF